MLQSTLTNKFIKYTAYAIVILSALVGLLAIVNISDLEFTWRLIIGFVIFINGAFGALILFAISEALNRLQEIEYNTERTYKQAEQSNKDWKRKASV